MTWAKAELLHQIPQPNLTELKLDNQALASDIEAGLIGARLIGAGPHSLWKGGSHDKRQPSSVSCNLNMSSFRRHAKGRGLEICVLKSHLCLFLGTHSHF